MDSEDARDSADVRQQESSQVASPKSRRWIPPLVGVLLLLLIAVVGVLLRGPTDERANGSRGSPRAEDLSQPRVVHTVHQAGPYTILELGEDEGPRFWLAAPRMDVAAGDRVVHGLAEEARNFVSKSLNRTFDRILLAREVFKLGPDGELIEQAPKEGGDPHGSMGEVHQDRGGGGEKVSKLAPPEGGLSLRELAAAPEKFAGKAVKVRGTIVKAHQRVRPTPGAAPTNWYHIQDEPLGPLLLFTTADDLQRGKVVVLRGALAVNKDFGSGMVYKLLLESPEITRE